MALLYSIENQLFSEPEMLFSAEEKSAQPRLAASTTDENGSRSVRLLVEEEEERQLPFTPIGLGRPLTIELQQVYRGQSFGGFGAGQKDLLVTSAIRPSAGSAGAPRAINRLDENFDQKNKFHDLSATRPGSSVLFHTPAVTDFSQVLTIEMVVDRFPGPALKNLASVVGNAGALPVFASASLYMLAASQVLKIAAGIGEKLFDGKPFFHESEDIRFGIPPFTTTAGQMLIVKTGRENEFRDYRLDERGKAVHRETGKFYEGDAPYASILLDGAKRPDLDGWASAEASADLLNRFFHTNQTGTLAEDLLKAMELYSDFDFRQKADEIKKRLETATDEEERVRLEVIYNGFIEKIRNEQFRPIKDES